jgi:hypothetical protein
MTASRGLPLQSVESEPVVDGVSPHHRLPLVEFRCSSAPAESGRYRIIGSAIPLRRWTGHEVFPSTIGTSAVETASNVPAPANLLAPSESDRTPTAIGPADSSSPGVWSLSALSAVEARFTRAYLTRHLPTSGFRTLLPACVFHSLPALFHAGNALRVFLQGFSPSQSLRPLSEPVTFVTFALCTRSRPSRPGENPSEVRRLQGFALCEDSPPPTSGVNHQSTTAALLVFRPLGSSPRQWPARLRGPIPS